MLQFNLRGRDKRLTRPTRECFHPYRHGVTEMPCLALVLAEKAGVKSRAVDSPTRSRVDHTGVVEGHLLSDTDATGVAVTLAAHAHVRPPPHSRSSTSPYSTHNKQNILINQNNLQ